MTRKSDSSSNQSASKAGKKSKRIKRVEQQEQQLQPSMEQQFVEEENPEEMNYQHSKHRDDVDSSDEERNHLDDDGEDDDTSLTGEDEQTMSELRSGRTNLADKDAGMPQADRDRLPPPTKTRRQRDTVDKEVAAVSGSS